MTLSRADAIEAFTDELERLEAEGVLVLDAGTRARVAVHHQDVRVALSGPERGAPRGLSGGMRIATLLGAIALSAAYALFIDSRWAAFPLVAQLSLVVLPPILLSVVTAIAAQREPSRYLASIAGAVAVVSFVVNLTVVGSLFNIPDSRHAFLAVGLFAMALAYGYRLSLVLVMGIVAMGLWLWSLVSVPSGAWWSSAFEQLEPLAVIGLLAIVLAPRLAGRAPFADEYRGVGAIALAGALLVMGQSAGASALPLTSGRLVEGLYQGIGALTFAAMIAIGLRRDWPELVRVGTGAAVVFLMLRLFDWFWDWLPKWVFFLVIGGVAVGVILLLRRQRVRTGAAT